MPSACFILIPLILLRNFRKSQFRGIFLDFDSVNRFRVPHRQRNLQLLRGCSHQPDRIGWDGPSRSPSKFEAVRTFHVRSEKEVQRDGVFGEREQEPHRDLTEWETDSVRTQSVEDAQWACYASSLNKSHVVEVEFGERVGPPSAPDKSAKSSSCLSCLYFRAPGTDTDSGHIAGGLAEMERDALLVSANSCPREPV